MNEVRKPCRHLEKDLSQRQSDNHCQIEPFNVWESFVFFKCVSRKSFRTSHESQMLPCGPVIFLSFRFIYPTASQTSQDVAEALEAQCWKMDSTSLPFPPPLLLTPPKFYISQPFVMLFKTIASEPLLTPPTSSSSNPINFNTLSPVHFSSRAPSQHSHTMDYWISILVVPSLILSFSLLNSSSRASNFAKIANLFHIIHLL